MAGRHRSTAPRRVSLASRPAGVAAFGPERPAPAGPSTSGATRDAGDRAGPTARSVRPTSGARGCPSRSEHQRRLRRAAAPRRRSSRSAPEARGQRQGRRGDRLLPSTAVRTTRDGEPAARRRSFGTPFQIAHGASARWRSPSARAATSSSPGTPAGPSRRATSGPERGFQPIETISSDADLLRADPGRGHRRRALLPGLEREVPQRGRLAAGRCSTRSPCARRATASAPPSASSATAERAAAGRARASRGAATPTVAWTGFDGANCARPRGASTDPSARFGAPRTSRPPAATGWPPISRPRAGRASSLGQRQLRRQPGLRRARPARGGPSAPPRRSPPPRRRAPATRSLAGCRRSCGPTGRPARTRRAAWPPCRPSPRPRRAPARQVERRSSPVYRG